MDDAKFRELHEQDRNFGLDLYRAVAIILVVLGHGGFLLNNSRFHGFPYFRSIDGVDLFFVLSGFLIGGILLRTINSTDRFGFNQLGVFWKRRWFRTLPNYFLVLLLNYFIVRSHVIDGDIGQANWKFIFFLQNFSSPFYGFFWESWSLSVEEWFYIFSPVLLMILLFVLKPKPAFLMVTLMMISLPLLHRWVSFDPALDNFWYDVKVRKIVLMRLDSIAYGLLGAWLAFYYKSYWIKFKWIAAGLGCLLMVFVVNYHSPNQTLYKQTIFLSLVPLSAFLLLPLSQSFRTANGFLARVITHISKISYSMYLLNFALVAEVMKKHFMPVSTADAVFKYIVYWLVVILASSVLYKYFEKPAMQLRDRKLLPILR